MAQGGHRDYVLNLFSTQVVDCDNCAPHFEGSLVFDSLKEAVDYFQEWVQHTYLMEWAKGIKRDESRATANICVQNRDNGRILEIKRDIKPLSALM